MIVLAVFDFIRWYVCCIAVNAFYVCVVVCVGFVWLYWFYVGV